jgi:hypothetical protein
MVDERRYLEPQKDAGRATAENGVVILEGPDGVAVTMTAEAADLTARSLHEAAQKVRDGDSAVPSEDDGNLEDPNRP